MRKDLKNRIIRNDLGLSVVVTTLIILVVGVLLATVVSVYATNLTLTRTKTEEVHITKERIWVNATGAVAAFKLQNLGGKDILVDGVIVRNIKPYWGNIYFYRVPSGTTVSGEMNVTSPARFTGESVALFGRTYVQAKMDIPLASGGVLLFYVKGITNIKAEDIGTTVSIRVYTNNAQYITDCNVESATQQ